MRVCRVCDACVSRVCALSLSRLDELELDRASRVDDAAQHGAVLVQLLQLHLRRARKGGRETENGQDTRADGAELRGVEGSGGRRVERNRKRARRQREKREERIRDNK
eukprot:1760104-Pleurochrysis_carterae.AAC.1